MALPKFHVGDKVRISGQYPPVKECVVLERLVIADARQMANGYVYRIKDVKEDYDAKYLYPEDVLEPVEVTSVVTVTVKASEKVNPQHVRVLIDGVKNAWFMDVKVT